jgi:hypothetical protein
MQPPSGHGAAWQAATVLLYSAGVLLVALLIAGLTLVA